MNKKQERRLGRGLAALLGTEDDGAPAVVPMNPDAVLAPRRRDEPAADEDTSPKGSTNILHLNVNEIEDNPFQPRREFHEEEIDSLAESLKEHQMLQPVLVRQHGAGYQLISGERRLRAAIKAGWQTVPAQVREADDRLVAELAIVENLQRKDLNPLEKAMSFKRYIDQHRCTQEDLASRLKIDRSTIANLMRLLELPESVLDDIRSGRISAGHARALLPLGEEQQQIEFSQKIAKDGLSVRATERMVQEIVIAEDEENPHRRRRTRTQNPQIVSLEQELRSALGTRVDIRQPRKGKGQIVVHFNSSDEFERLRRFLADGQLQVG